MKKTLYILQICIGFTLGIIGGLFNIAWFAFLGSIFTIIGTIQLREEIDQLK